MVTRDERCCCCGMKCREESEGPQQWGRENHTKTLHSRCGKRAAKWYPKEGAHDQSLLTSSEKQSEFAGGQQRRYTK